MKVCAIHGCPNLHNTKSTRCPEHATQARRERVANKVYNTRGHHTFREAVLTRDTVCVIQGCVAWATVADHYPRDRRELVELGLNPNNPDYGRGLCATHHNQHTAATNPAGFRA